jgi:hypothetical protein
MTRLANADVMLSVPDMEDARPKKLGRAFQADVCDFSAIEDGLDGGGAVS